MKWTKTKVKYIFTINFHTQIIIRCKFQLQDLFSFINFVFFPDLKLTRTKEILRI